MNPDIDEQNEDSAASADDPARRQGESIDRSVLEQLNALTPPGSSEPFAVKAAKLYIRSTASLVTQMQDGFAAQDANVVRLAAHTLQSSSRTLGATKLARLARDLEALAESGSLPDAGRMVTAIAEEHRCACTELEQFIGQAA